MALASVEAFLDCIRKSGVVEDERLAAYMESVRAGDSSDMTRLAGLMVRDALLTRFQAEQLLAGRWRGFQIGKYRVLEPLGSGGMGSVYLAEHKVMKRRVAIKLLPKGKAKDSSALERFYREARAVAALDHANIVRAYDIDQDGEWHFLVMEWVDGTSLQDIVKNHGTLDPARAANYIGQSALGLQHAHGVGLVHRDIKPGNLLVDRLGTVKILDMGLARFFNDEDDALTKKYDENVLGTADYLAPEQALDSHSVDIRADIYSLGCTFYFLLTGRPPFSEGTVAQKLIWHQSRQPKSLKELQPDVPDVLVAIVEKMMAKDAAERYATPQEVAQALETWIRKPVAAPRDEEMPQHSPAVQAPQSAVPVHEVPSPPVAAVSSTAKTDLKKPASDAAASDKPASPPPPARTTPTPRPSRPVPRPAPTSDPPNNGAKLPGAMPDRSPAVRIAPARMATPVAPRSDPPAIVPADREEPFPWLADQDTDAPAAALNDTLRSGVRRSLSRRPAGLAKLWKEKPGYVLGGAAALVVGVALIAYMAFFGDNDPSSPGQRPGVSGPGNSKPAPRDPVTLYVSKEGEKDFRTIQAALDQAGSGDTILLRATPVWEEKLELTAAKLKGKRDLTIRAEDATVLRPPADHDSNQQLVVIENVAGLKLRGFTLDGQKRVAELVSVSGNCAGLELRDLHLLGFTQTGMTLTACRGVRGQEIRLSRLRFDPQRPAGEPVDAALAFTRPPRTLKLPPEHSHVQVQDCRIEGPYAAAVRLQAPMFDCVIERTIFFGGKQNAVIFSDSSRQGTVVQCRLTNNTFCDFQAGLVLEAAPAPGSVIDLTNNLFYQVTGQAGRLDGMLPAEAQSAFAGEGNVIAKDQAQPGNLPVVKFTALILPVLSTANDETFLTYPKDHELAKSGKGGTHVGARAPR